MYNKKDIKAHSEVVTVFYHYCSIFPDVKNVVC